MNHEQRRRLDRANKAQRGFSRHYDRHHSVPKSRQDDVQSYDVRADSNIVIVPAGTHRNFHSLFANLLPHEICNFLNRGWCDPRAEMIAVWRGEDTDKMKRTNSGILYR